MQTSCYAASSICQQRGRINKNATLLPSPRFQFLEEVHEWITGQELPDDIPELEIDAARNLVIDLAGGLIAVGLRFLTKTFGFKRGDAFGTRMARSILLWLGATPTATGVDTLRPEITDMHRQEFAMVAGTAAADIWKHAV